MKFRKYQRAYEGLNEDEIKELMEFKYGSYTGTAPIEDVDIEELHKIRLEWFLRKNLSHSKMMSYLVAEFVGTMALAGYSDEFAEKTFDMMFQKFIGHPLRTCANKDNRKNKTEER